MKIEQRAAAFIELGIQLKSISKEEKTISEEASTLMDTIENAKNLNGWFTRANILHAIRGIADSLEKEKFNLWLKPYQDKLNQDYPKRICVLMAGNIPLVGFHDMLCVLISGHHFVGKTSSKDGSLTNAVAQLIINIEPEFRSKIEFEQNSFSSIDAIIATGSNNASGYIKYYFDKYPNLIRENRNSVAILTGKESKEELELLGEDIFRYFGLGCRNVSKIYVPKNYDFDNLFKGIFKYSAIVENNKYANNYDYNKAILLLDKAELLDNGFILLKEDQQIASPVGTLHYEYYDSIEKLSEKLVRSDADQIQCVVSIDSTIPKSIPLGSSQAPELWEYADGIDTLEFLNTLSNN
ncbi:MAG: acyl-CoA reductase [Bacteroidetes bacterium]|nr:MAG: acyl-CoA reductase [Bacteroidota bacterium]